MTSFQQVQYEFGQHLRDPEAPLPNTLKAIELRRLKIYQELIFKNVEGFISGGFPVLRQLYNEQDWSELIRDFIIKHESHSPYFLEISEEFLAYLQEERVMQESDPAFMLELAHYEWVELALDVAEADLSEPMDKNLLADLPQVSPLVWTLSYQYPVHLIGPEYQPTEPPEQSTFLLVYRTREDKVAFMESNAVTVSALQLLSSGDFASGQAMLEHLGQQIQHPDIPAFVTMGHELLLKLQKSDIIF